MLELYPNILFHVKANRAKQNRKANKSTHVEEGRAFLRWQAATEAIVSQKSVPKQINIYIKTTKIK